MQIKLEKGFNTNEKFHFIKLFYTENDFVTIMTNLKSQIEQNLLDSILEILESKWKDVDIISILEKHPKAKIEEIITSNTISVINAVFQLENILDNVTDFKELA